MNGPWPTWMLLVTFILSSFLLPATASDCDSQWDRVTSAYAPALRSHPGEWIDTSPWKRAEFLGKLLVSRRLLTGDPRPAIVARHTGTALASLAWVGLDRTPHSTPETGWPAAPGRPRRGVGWHGAAGVGDGRFQCSENGLRSGEERQSIKRPR